MASGGVMIAAVVGALLRPSAVPRAPSPRLSAEPPLVGEKLSLQVSSPALLLNHMAERYISTSRILMEFVDNSLDDAEALFDHDTGAYSRNVTIDVHV